MGQEPQLKVLVMGSRNPLRRALRSRKIAFVVWNTKPAVKPKKNEIHSPFPKNISEAKLMAAELFNDQRVSHIIAGTEDAVLPASLMRKALGARRSKHSLLRRCSDKLEMKKFLSEKKVPMTDFLEPRKVSRISKLLKKWGEPLVYKPRKSSGSYGIEFLWENNLRRYKKKHNYILEKYIQAKECSIESFVCDRKIIFTNITEYYEKTFVNIVPAGFSKKLKKQIEDLNKQVIESLGVEWGMTHLEVYLTRQGPIFGEIALRPPGGYIMELIQQAYGFDPWQALVAIELDLDFQDLPKKVSQIAAAQLIYPPTGVVSEVTGVDELKKESSHNLKLLRLKISKGSSIEKRQRLGQEYGHAIWVAENRKTILNYVRQLKSKLKIRMMP